MEWTAHQHAPQTLHADQRLVETLAIKRPSKETPPMMMLPLVITDRW